MGGDLGAVAGDELVPLGGCLLFVLGGLVPGFEAGPPPVQCPSAGEGGAAGRRSVAGELGDCFLGAGIVDQVWPAAAAAMSAAVAALFSALGSPLETR